MPTSRPRVALDVTTLLTTAGLHGIGRYVMELAAGLAAVRDEAELDVVAVGALGPEGSLVQSEDLVGLTEELLAAEPLGIWIAWFRRLAMMARVERSGVDLLHLPEPLGTPLHGRVRRVTTCHDLYPLRHPREHLPLGLAELPIRYLREQRRYRFVERVLAISDETRRDLRRWLRIPDDRIDVVPCGIDLSRFTPAGDDDRALASLDLPAAPWFLFVGNWGDRRKRVVDLVDALAEARRHTDVKLVIAGKTSDHRAKPILDRIAERGVGDAVHRLGFVPDELLPSLYRRATALVLISAEEGFGYPVVEAMACGSPVVLRDESGADRFCTDGGGVVVSRAGAVSETAAAMARLATDPDFRAELAAQAPRAAAAYSREAMARGALESYRRALG